MSDPLRGAEGRYLTKQVVVRVEPELHAALVADARRNGRTVAQSIRFHLRTAVGSK
jgi:predicted HicB family RNase H-like nuclease